MNRKPKPIVRAGMYLILIGFAIFALYPIWFAFLASGRLGDRLYTLDLPGMFFPTEWTFENYRAMLFEKPFLTWMKNSLGIAFVTTAACMLFATTAAYAFSRLRFRGRQLGLVAMLAITAFPAVLSLVPVVQLLTAMGLYKSHVGLVFAYSTAALIFCTWNLKGFFDTIPVDLEEAGMVDGCGPVASFWRIALPLSKPALATTALFAFLASWGDFILASVLVPAPDSMKTLMPGMFSLANSQSVPWGYFAAGTVLVIMPVLILYLFLQRSLVSGLAAGGVKG